MESICKSKLFEYILFLILENEKIEASNKPVGIVMGEVGSGKTTLFNKICNT